jgi:CspA family cold shock protein
MRTIVLDGGSAEVVAAMFTDTSLALVDLLKPAVMVLSSPCSPELHCKLEKACPTFSIIVRCGENRTAAARGRWIVEWLGSQTPCPPFVVIDSCEAVGHNLPAGHFIYSCGPRSSSPNVLAGHLLNFFNKAPSAVANDLVEGIILDGVVKRYNPTKGFGFITSNTVDIFVHQSAIQGDGFRGLNTGCRVKFTVQRDDKGRQVAASVFQHSPYVASNLVGRPVEGGMRSSKRKEDRPASPSPGACPRTASPRRKLQKSLAVRRTRYPQFSFLAHDGTVYFSTAMSASATPYDGPQHQPTIESSNGGRPLTDN